MTPARYMLCTPIAILLCGLAVPSQSQLRFESGNFAQETSALSQPLLLSMTQAPHRAPNDSPEPEVIESEPEKIEPKAIKKAVKPEPKPKKQIKEKAKPEKQVKQQNVVKKEPKKVEELVEALPQPQNLTSGVTQKTIVLDKPTFLQRPKAPRYPKLARKRGFEGTTLVEVKFNQFGKQIEQLIIESSGYELLDKAALKAVSEWKFSAPSQFSAKLYSVRVPVRFALNS